MAMVFCRGCGKELDAGAAFCPHCGFKQELVPVVGIKSQNVATLLVFFLGGLGVHRFYLGRPVAGVLYLLFCWTGIPSIMAFAEVYLFAFWSQQTWADKFNQGRISEPVHVAIKVLVLIVPTIFLIAMLAAIAVPAYHGYTVRAHQVEGV